MIEILKISVITFIFSTLLEEGSIFEWYDKLICRLPEWLYKPLGGCYRCLTGQTLFWYYIIVHFNDYNVIEHLFYPSLGIFLVTIYNYIHEKIRF